MTPRTRLQHAKTSGAEGYDESAASRRHRVCPPDRPGRQRRRSAAERGLFVQPGELVRVADRVDAGDPAVRDHQADRRVELAGEIDPAGGRAVQPHSADHRIRRDVPPDHHPPSVVVGAAADPQRQNRATAARARAAAIVDSGFRVRGASPPPTGKSRCTGTEFAVLRNGFYEWRRRELNPRPRSRV
jgi:hypothetical protein